MTDAGFYNPRNLDQPLTALINRFAKMLGKPFCEAKVLFIPTAAIGSDDEAKEITDVEMQAVVDLYIRSFGISQEVYCVNTNSHTAQQRIPLPGY